MKLDPTDRKMLFDILGKYFSLRELQAMSFELEVDHENLYHQTKLEFLPDFILHCARRNRIPELAVKISQERPKLLPLLNHLLPAKYKSTDSPIVIDKTDIEESPSPRVQPVPQPQPSHSPTPSHITNQVNSREIPVFCHTCGRYIGVGIHCVDCNQDRPPYQPLPQPNTPYWQLSADGRPHTEPLYHQGTLYLAEANGNVKALEALTGHLIWQRLLPKAQPRQKMVYDTQLDHLYVNDRHQTQFWVLDGLTSKLIHKIPNPRNTTATLSDPLLTKNDRIYFGDAEGYVHAVQRNGQKPHSHWTPLSVGQTNLNAFTNWHTDWLLATSRGMDGHLVAISQHNGDVQQWDQIHGRAFTPQILTEQALAIVSSDQGEIFAYDIRHRRRFWSHKEQDKLLAQPLATSLHVFSGDRSGNVTALDIEIGKELWSKTNLQAGTIRGLAYWEGLLFIGTHQGGIIALDSLTGEKFWQWSAGGCITAGPLVVEGIVYGGSEAAGWFALPWHLGQWSQAAQWSLDRGWTDTAAACFALANQPDKASKLWFTHRQARQTAQMWLSIGENNKAATAFRHAAEKEDGTNDPLRAAGAWMRAAYYFDAAQQPQEARECRRRAGNAGRFAYIDIQPFNLPTFEVAVQGQVAFKISNWGNDTAHDIYFYLGGQLTHLVEAKFDTLASYATAIVTINHLTPSRAGEQMLKVSLSYQGGDHTGNHSAYEYPIQVAPPPPGLIHIQGDAGTVIVKALEGQPLPTVRGDNIGLIRYEVHPK